MSLDRNLPRVAHPQNHSPLREATPSQTWGAQRSPTLFARGPPQPSTAALTEPPPSKDRSRGRNEAEGSNPHVHPAVGPVPASPASPQDTQDWFPFTRVTYCRYPGCHPGVPVTALSMGRGWGAGGEPERACPATYLPGHQTLAGDSRLHPTHTSALASSPPPKRPGPMPRCPAWGHPAPQGERRETHPAEREPRRDRRAPKERAQVQSSRSTAGRGEDSHQGEMEATGIHGGPRHSSGRLGESHCWRETGKEGELQLSSPTSRPQTTHPGHSTGAGEALWPLPNPDWAPNHRWGLGCRGEGGEWATTPFAGRFQFSGEQVSHTAVLNSSRPAAPPVPGSQQQGQALALAQDVPQVHPSKEENQREWEHAARPRGSDPLRYSQPRGWEATERVAGAGPGGSSRAGTARSCGLSKPPSVAVAATAFPRRQLKAECRPCHSLQTSAPLSPSPRWP